MRLLIANRGEIARRIIRTADDLGIETVAAYADPDADAPFVTEASISVRLGPADLAQSYLSIDALLNAAATTQATAVHPGYGFLSENADFAAAVLDSGRQWVGPNPGVVAAMGSKIEARRLAEAANVPVIPGFDKSQDRTDLEHAATRIGFPVLVKAALGGGGKGIRIVERSEDFAAALGEAQTEAQRAFGDDAMIVERYIQSPRHVEVQIVGDHHGNVIHLGTRECSVQRRFQKVLEEAPAPNLPDATRDGLETAAVTLAAHTGYDSAGTVEFIVDDETGEFFFLEMNTRLQVEHPVTELVTNLDIVALQIQIASGAPLELRQEDIELQGHAFEARINAEDATEGFAPQTGTISHLRVPDGVRWDSAVELGSTVSSHYDSMIAKLVVGGPDRATARRRLAVALDDLVVGGIVTTSGFHRWLIDQPPIVDGRVTTRFLDETRLPGRSLPPTEIAAAVWREATRGQRTADAWHALGAFRILKTTRVWPIALRDHCGDVHTVDTEIDATWDGSHLDVHRSTRRRVAAVVDFDTESVALNVGGHTHTFEIVARSELWAPEPTSAAATGDAIVAPFPGTVVEVFAAPGDAVGSGDPLVAIEAMKMIHTLTAQGDMVVDEIRVAAGTQVESGQVVVTFVQELASAQLVAGESS